MRKEEGEEEGRRKEGLWGARRAGRRLDNEAEAAKGIEEERMGEKVKKEGRLKRRLDANARVPKRQRKGALGVSWH